MFNKKSRCAAKCRDNFEFGIAEMGRKLIAFLKRTPVQHIRKHYFNSSRLGPPEVHKQISLQNASKCKIWITPKYLLLLTSMYISSFGVDGCNDAAKPTQVPKSRRGHEKPPIMPL